MKPLTYLFVDFENLQPPAKDVALVRGEEYRLWIFHGPHQKKFAAEMVVAWQPLGEHAHFVQSSKPGKNALDFHIAFTLGRLYGHNASPDCRTRYIVVSNDGGFGSLFDYMRKLGCIVGKAASIPEALTLAQSLVPESMVLNGESRQTPLASPTVVVAQSGRPAAIAASLPEKKTDADLKSSGDSQKPSQKIPPVLRKTLAHDDADKVIAELREHPRNRPSDRKALERHIVSVLRNKVTLQVSRAVIKELEQRKLISFNGEKIAYTIPKAKK